MTSTVSEPLSRALGLHDVTLPLATGSSIVPHALTAHRFFCLYNQITKHLCEEMRLCLIHWALQHLINSSGYKYNSNNSVHKLMASKLHAALMCYLFEAVLESKPRAWHDRQALWDWATSQPSFALKAYKNKISTFFPPGNYKKTILFDKKVLISVIFSVWTSVTQIIQIQSMPAA